MMQSDTEPAPPGPSLRDKLQARGAKPHRRMSDLSRYMLAHYDELHALITVDRYGWADIASLLAEDEGLVDELGRPITAAVAKLTWSRLTRRNRRSVPPKPAARREGDSPAAQATLPPPATENDLPSASAEWPPLEMRPVRLRDSATPVPAPAAAAGGSTPSLFNDEEVERRIADVASRQGGKKIPPPKVL
jgi:hypothetical protein